LLRKIPVFDVTPPFYQNESKIDEFARLILRSYESDKKRLKKLIFGAKFRMLDLQKDKLMEQYNLRCETEQQRNYREQMFESVGYENTRPNLSPCIPLILDNKQYRKLTFNNNCIDEEISIRSSKGS